MVEVTKSNFEEMIPCVEKAIRNSSFIAIDAEFTGLHLGSENEISLFDTLKERYRKLRASATAFIPCQIGLSIFTKHRSENMYMAETYVFYVRPYLCGSSDKCFMFQASCIDFLSRYEFDFNKLVKEGIPYINAAEEQQIQKEIEDSTFSYPYEELMDVRWKKKMDILINSKFMSTKQLNKSDMFIENASSTVSSRDEKKIVLEVDEICHAYFQLNMIRRKYPSLWAYLENNKIIIEKISPERRKEIQQKIVKEEEKRLFLYFLGFTRIFRILQEVKKPIIGHNLLMDLLLFFHHFYKPLPGSYKDFKKELHNLFPVIYDTRQIWRHVKKHYKLKNIPKNCGLFDLLEMFKNPSDSLSTLFSPGVKHCNGGKYIDEQCPHESGYDAFVTGWVFLKICHLLAMKKIKSSIHIQPLTVKQHFDAVSPFENKLNLGRSLVSYIDLTSSDPLPSVPELVYVCRRSKVQPLNKIELSRTFEQYGMVEIKLLGNKKAAVIAVGTLRSYIDILKDFENSDEFLVARYNVFKHSPVIHSALWLTAIGSGCMVAFLVHKLFSQP